MSDYTVKPIVGTDYEEWVPLWKAYLEFYHTTLPQSQYESTFARLTTETGNVQGLLARDENGTACGIAHYLFHSSCWTEKSHCYLNDLYTTPEMRGKGLGRSLIQAVEEKAKQAGSARLYWSTAPDNATARKLYDSLATTDRVQYRINL